MSGTHCDVELKEKYPHPSGKKYVKGVDREEFQYHKLVCTLEIHVAEFVLKWEFDHKNRIPKMLAWKLLTERKTYGKISNGFLNKMNEEYE